MQWAIMSSSNRQGNMSLYAGPTTLGKLTAGYTFQKPQPPSKDSKVLVQAHV